MSKELESIYTELIKLAASMFRHESEPSIYIDELKFCKTTPWKDKVRRANDNEKNYDLTHRRAHKIKLIAAELRKELTR